VYWHYAHSFVRGNWANSERSGPMILTKCCHDLDLLVWMFGTLPTDRLVRLAHSLYTSARWTGNPGPLHRRLPDRGRLSVLRAAPLFITLRGESGRLHNQCRHAGAHTGRNSARAGDWSVWSVCHEIMVHDHLTGEEPVSHIPRRPGGHSGGDEGLMHAFVAEVRDGSLSGGGIGMLTSALESVESHLLAFAAERARVSGTVVDTAAFRQSVSGVTV
jgi:predicted dehydrogenase